MSLGSYGYDPVEHRQNFNFIGDAAHGIGKAIDTGAALQRQGQDDQFNQQLYSQIKAHAASIDPKIREQIGYGDDVISGVAPIKGESRMEYVKRATSLAHDLQYKAYQTGTSGELAKTIGAVESGAYGKEVQQAEQEGVTAGRQGVAPAQFADSTTFGPKTAMPPPATEFTNPAFTNAPRQGMPISPPVQDQSAFQQSTPDGVTPLDVRLSPENAVQGLNTRPGLNVNAQPETDFNRTALPENTPAGANQKRPVTASEVADAAVLRGVADAPGVKEMETTREKDDLTKTREALTQMGITSREKIAGEGSETKKEIADKNNLTRMLLAKDHANLQLRLEHFKAGQKSKNDYDVLKKDYLKIQIDNDKALTEAQDRMKTGLDVKDLKDHVATLTGNQQAIADEIAMLDKAEEESGTPLGKTKKKAASQKSKSDPLNLFK